MIDHINLHILLYEKLYLLIYLFIFSLFYVAFQQLLENENLSNKIDELKQI